MGVHDVGAWPCGPLTIGGYALKKGWHGICLPIGISGPLAENTGSLCCSMPVQYVESEINPLFLRRTHDNV